MQEESNKVSFISKVGDKFRGFDQFSESFHMRMDNGNHAYPSFFGAILSFVVVLFIAAFAFAKMDTLLGFKDVDVIERVVESFFEHEE